MSRGRLVSVYAALLGALWLALAIHPLNRHDWLLENALLVAGVVLLWATYRVFPLSKISYGLIFLFLCLHTIGAHYTYAEVPYREWLAQLSGRPAVLDGRNYFDRLVHFSYGLLLAYPLREVFLRIANVRGFWGYFLPLDLTMSSSMVYELLEWASAVVFGGDLGVAFLGTQGDEWDAQKDMAMASLGALITMSCAALVSWRYKRDFAAEWADSLRIHHPRPLDE